MQPKGYIQIELTSRCNLSCAACPHGVDSVKLQERDMPVEVFEQMVDATIRPGRHYHLQGWGEPLLRKDLPDLARFVADRGGLPSVTTNGTLITADLAENLVQAGLDFITISLAAGRPDIQRENRPGAELQTILEAFRKLKKAKKKHRRMRPRLVASFELTRAGIDSFGKAVKLLKKAGAERVIAIHPILASTSAQEANLLIGLSDPGEKETAMRALRRASLAAMWRSISFYCEPLESKIMPVCREDPLCSLFVGASGDISPCAFLGLPVAESFTARYLGWQVKRDRVSMGNLRQSRIAEIWDSREYRAFRQAYLARKVEAEQKGPLLGVELESPLPDPCRGCIRALGY
jgi:MoaA/NifB/PqqE/SkfB family radical SAM enzyme